MRSKHIIIFIVHRLSERTTAVAFRRFRTSCNFTLYAVYANITLIIPWPLVKHNRKDNIIIKQRVDRIRKLLTIKQRRGRGGGPGERETVTEKDKEIQGDRETERL